MWEGEAGEGGGRWEVGGGGFLTQLAASGQTVPLVVARGECAVLRNRSHRDTAPSQKGPHPVAGFKAPHVWIL